MKLTIVYDNNPPVQPVADAGDPLVTAWGFACLVETGDAVILFDTGGDGATLLGNAKALGIDLAAVDAIVLSHYHWDHIGGFDLLLGTGIRPTVYVPASCPPEFRQALSERAVVVAVTDSARVADRVRTTGEMGGAIVEQSLVIETDPGLVLVTGCAHPGIVEIVRSVASEGEIALVIGGFHLKDATETICDDAAAQLQKLGVRHVAPTHCTGALAIERFELAFGECFVPVGLGSVIEQGRLLCPRPIRR